MKNTYTLETISKELFSDSGVLKRIIQGQRLLLTKVGISGLCRTKIFIGYLIENVVNLGEDYWQTAPVVRDDCTLVSSINFVTNVSRIAGEFRVSIPISSTRVVNVVSYLEALEEDKIFPCFLYTTERKIQEYALSVNSHRTLPDVHFFSFASPFLILTEISVNRYSLEIVHNSRKEFLPTQINIGDLFSLDMRQYDILSNTLTEVLIPYLSLSRAVYYFNRGEQFTMSIWLYTFFESFLAILLWFLNLENEFRQLQKRNSEYIPGKDFIYYIMEKKEKGDTEDWMHYTKRGISWVVRKIDSFIPSFKTLIKNFESDTRWKRLRETRRNLSHMGFAYIKGEEFLHMLELAGEFNTNVVDYIESLNKFPLTADLFKRPSFSKNLREFFDESIEQGNRMYNEILEEIK